MSLPGFLMSLRRRNVAVQLLEDCVFSNEPAGCLHNCGKRSYIPRERRTYILDVKIQHLLFRTEKAPPLLRTAIWLFAIVALVKAALTPRLVSQYHQLAFPRLVLAASDCNQ